MAWKYEYFATLLMKQQSSAPKNVLKKCKDQLSAPIKEDISLFGALITWNENLQLQLLQCKVEYFTLNHPWTTIIFCPSALTKSVLYSGAATQTLHHSWNGPKL